MKSKAFDPTIRAQFRERAREIIGSDRVARRNGSSQDTIGQIERALVRAFLLGKEHGPAPYASPRAVHLGIEWEEVRPRGRDVLIAMTLRTDPIKVDVIGLRCVPIDGRERWAQVYANGRQSTHTVGPGSVTSLVRNSLLELSDASLLVLTAKGRATCDAYWRRRAGDGPALPRESLRS